MSLKSEWQVDLQVYRDLMDQAGVQYERDHPNKLNNNLANANIHP